MLPLNKFSLNTKKKNAWKKQLKIGNVHLVISKIFNNIADKTKTNHSTKWKSKNDTIPNVACSS